MKKQPALWGREQPKRLQLPEPRSLGDPQGAGIWISEEGIPASCHWGEQEEIGSVTMGKH